MAYDTKSKNSAVTALLNGTAPEQVKTAAARGILPLPQDDLLEVLVTLAESTDAELAKIASGTIATQDSAAIESGSITRLCRTEDLVLYSYAVARCCATTMAKRK